MLSKEELIQIMGTFFLDVLNGPVQNHQFNPLAEGFSQLVYEVDERYVLRVPKSKEAIVNMQNGLQIDRWLQMQNITWTYPRPLLMKSILEPYPMLMLERIKGKSPSHVNPSIRAESAERLAILLRSLHECDPTDFVKLGIDRPRYQRMERDTLINDTKKRLDDARAKKWLTLQEWNRVESFLAQFEKCADLDDRKVVVHGDFHPLNFLVDAEGEICAVIDWDDAHLSHPAVDLSIVYTWFPSAARERFWLEYGVQDEVTKCWARMTGIYIAIHVLWAAVLLKDQERESFARQMLRDGVSE